MLTTNFGISLIFIEDFFHHISTVGIPPVISYHVRWNNKKLLFFIVDWYNSTHVYVPPSVIFILRPFLNETLIGLLLCWINFWTFRLSSGWITEVSTICSLSFNNKTSRTILLKREIIEQIKINKKGENFTRNCRNPLFYTFIPLSKKSNTHFTNVRTVDTETRGAWPWKSLFLVSSISLAGIHGGNSRRGYKLRFHLRIEKKNRLSSYKLGRTDAKIKWSIIKTMNDVRVGY